jgi:hypothetical protein
MSVSPTAPLPPGTVTAGVNRTTMSALSGALTTW